MLLNLGRSRWLKSLLAAIILYLLLTPVWLLLLDGFVLVAASIADFFYGLLDPAVTITPTGDAVNVTVRATAQSALDPKTLSSGLSMGKVTYGIPLVAALVIVTRADSHWARARALAIGLAVMSLASVLAIMMWAKLTGLQLEEQLAQAASTSAGDRSSFFYYTFHGYAFSQPVLAVALWLALILLGSFKDKKRLAQSAAVSRNAACPCGSGKKYKRCCGSG